MKILIVKTSSLGDIIHTFPVLGYLHRRNPEVEIDWVVEAPFADILEAHPLVHRVIPVQTKEWRKGRRWGALWEARRQLRRQQYDLLFDFQGNVKSALLTWQVRAKHKVGFAFGAVPEWPNLLVTNCKYCPPKGQNIREDYLFLVQRYFDDGAPFQEAPIALKTTSQQEAHLQQILLSFSPQFEKRIMVCPGSAWRNKQMTLAALVQLLKRFEPRQKGCFLITWGNAAEREVAEEIWRAFPETSYLLDKLELPTLQNLMDRVDFVIAMDSLPLHLAGTTSTPTLGIFGPSSSEKYRPRGSQHRVFQGSCPYGKTFEKRCPLLRTCSTGACLRHLSGDEIEIPNG